VVVWHFAQRFKGCGRSVWGWRSLPSASLVAPEYGLKEWHLRDTLPTRGDTGVYSSDEQYNWKETGLTLWQFVQLTGPDSILAEIIVLNSTIGSSEVGRRNPAPELDASLFVVIKEVCK